MSKMSEHLKNNLYRQVLKTPELRQRAFEKYCAWVAKGKTKRSFYFEDEENDVSLTWESMEKYIRDYPQELDASKFAVAYSKGLDRWEKVLDDTADGVRKDTSIPAIQIILRNKYRWDTEEHRNNMQEAKADLSQFVDSMQQGREEHVAKNSQCQDS